MSIFNFLKKQSRTWGAILMTMAEKVIWTKKDYAGFARAGYQSCMDAYACIKLIAETTAQIPWLLYQKQEDGSRKEVEIHKLLDLMRRPNPQDGGKKFIDRAIRFLLIAGNSYIESVGPNSGPPKELYALRPDRMQVLAGNSKQFIQGYRYTVGGEKTDFNFDEILHLKFFHPTNDFYGLSPMEVAMRGIDISILAQEWNANLLKNDCRPPGAFIIKGKLEEDEFNIVAKRIKEKYSGSEKAGEPLILAGGDIDWKQNSISPHDMDWLNADKMTTRKICRVYGIAPELIGDSENKTYSNYQEARLALYMETIIPLAYWVRDELNNWLTPKFGDNLLLDLNLDQIDALQQKRNEAYNRMAQAWWLSLNQKLAACGYSEIGEAGNVIYIPMGLTPVTLPSLQGKSKKKIEIKKALLTKGYWKVPERKDLLWKNFVSRITAKEKSFKSRVESFLRKQAREIREKIEQATGLVYINKTELFSQDKEMKEYIKTFMPHYLWFFKKAGDAGMDVSEGKLYDIAQDMKEAGRFEFTQELKEELERLVMNSAKYINEETVKKMLEMIEKAEAEDWTVEDLSHELWEKFKDLSISRAERIARTETGKVENYGNLEGYKQMPFVERKGWLCSFVKDSRQEHMDADRRYSDNPILLEEAFIVGGEELQYPGDPKGSAGNICNCLCGTYPEIGEE
jgi:HK97 family phage portal protein